MITKEFIDKCIKEANMKHSKLKSGIDLVTRIKGLSSQRMQHLLNNLLAEEDRVYTEIGVYKGFTMCGALWENPSVKAYAVDNFSINPFRRTTDKKRWDLIQEEFELNLEKLDLDIQVKLKNHDILLQKLPEVQDKSNVIFIDLDPKPTDTSRTLKNIKNIFADNAIIIVGYYNKNYVKIEAEDFFNTLKSHKVDYFRYMKAMGYCDTNSWWAGLGIFLINKESSNEKSS